MGSLKNLLDNQEVEIVQLHKLDREDKTKEKEDRLFYLSAMDTLVYALEAKDKYTAGHSQRVAEMSVSIGKELKLPADELEDLRWGALLHDIGKIAVDQAIQNKKGKLTNEEYQQVMVHVDIGAKIVRWLTNTRTVEMIKNHHCHYDGKREEQALTGKDIPLGARIIALADAYDAMTSDRPYRDALPVDETMVEIQRCTGSQFDPMVVSAFCRVVDFK